MTLNACGQKTKPIRIEWTHIHLDPRCGDLAERKKLIDGLIRRFSLRLRANTTASHEKFRYTARRYSHCKSLWHNILPHFNHFVCFTCTNSALSLSLSSTFGFVFQPVHCKRNTHIFFRLGSKWMPFIHASIQCVQYVGLAEERKVALIMVQIDVDWIEIARYKCLRKMLRCFSHIGGGCVEKHTERLRPQFFLLLLFTFWDDWQLFCFSIICSNRFFWCELLHGVSQFIHEEKTKRAQIPRGIPHF